MKKETKKRKQNKKLCANLKYVKRKTMQETVIFEIANY